MTMLTGRWGVIAGLALALAAFVPRYAEAAPQQARRAVERLGLAPQRRPPGKSQMQGGRRPGLQRAPADNPRVLQMLLRMTGPQRERFFRNNRAFQGLPSAQQKRLRDRLAQLDRMAPAERQLLLQRYRLFQRLPPDKREDARRIYERWRVFPAARREAIVDEIEGLREMSAADRRARIASEEFASSYSAEEKQVMRGLFGLYPRR